MWPNGLQNTFFFLRRDRCEKGVMSSVNVRNCIRFYQTAEELNATTLMNYCGEIIASHWVSTVGQCLYVANKATLGGVCVCVWMDDYWRDVGTENPALPNQINVLSGLCDHLTYITVSISS